jgi:hypothetical protein
MKDIREEAADLLGDQIAEIEEQKHEKEMARLERKERQRIKERNKWIERMVAPLLFLVTLVISALVMLLF